MISLVSCCVRNSIRQRLVDPLQRRHFRMLCRVRGVAGSFELADVGLPLRGVRPDCADGLQIAGVHGVDEIDRRAPRCDVPAGPWELSELYPVIWPVRGMLAVLVRRCCAVSRVEAEFIHCRELP